MSKTMFIPILLIILASLVTGCGALQAVVPLPEPTTQPTLTAVLYTPSPLPTLGTLEYLNAAYCFDADPNPDDEYNLLRFFRSGVVLELKVQGRGSCQASWDYVSPYLVETATDTFNHGEYQLSGSQIQFTLAPANSDEVAGIVTGRYEGDKMLLQQQGVSMEYVLVYGGK